MTPKSLVITICVFCFACSSSHMFADDIDWLNKIAAADFETTVAILHENKNVWPYLPSQQRLHAQNESTAWYDLALIVFQKMADYDAAMMPSELYGAVDIYSRATRSFRRRGGYSNYVLANAAETLALSLLSAQLIDTPSEHVLVQQALRAFPHDPITGEYMRNILEEEAGMILTDKEFSEFTLSDLLNRLGLDMSEFVNRASLDSVATQNLLTNNDVAGLLWRVITNETTKRMHLRGYIALLRRGGEYSDSMIADTTEWNRIMASVERQYGYPELGIPSVRPSYIGPWIRACSEGHKRTPFYALVLGK